jgi:hypothetical protein
MKKRWRWHRAIQPPTLLVAGLLLAGCSQPSVSGTIPDSGGTTAPAPPPLSPTTAGYLPSVGNDAYVDVTGKVLSIAVPVSQTAPTPISPQALLTSCGRPEDISLPYYPGSLFYNRQTYPGDDRLDGVNYQYIPVDNLKFNPLMAPYDAPIRKVNGTASDLYDKDAAGQYKIRKAYPDIYLLGGIAGAGEFGREMYFGFHYVRNGTADGLPGLEPYIQITDPKTSRVAVADIRPVIDGRPKFMKLNVGNLNELGFEIFTNQDHTTRLYLYIGPYSDSIVKFYDLVQTSGSTTFSRYYPKANLERILVWEGKVSDIRGNPGFLDNQIRKFGLRINYGPFIKDGVLYTSQDTAAFTSFVTSRTDFASIYSFNPQMFGSLAVANFGSGDVLSKKNISDEAFNEIQDPRQECSTSRTLKNKTEVIVGDEVAARGGSGGTTSSPPILSNLLPDRISITSGVGLIASEPARYEYYAPSYQSPSVNIGYSYTSGYAVNVRSAQELVPQNGSGGFALDFRCKSLGHFDVPINIWEVSTPGDKKTGTLSVDCVDNPSLDSPTAGDSSGSALQGLRQDWILVANSGVHTGL